MTALDFYTIELELKFQVIMEVHSKIIFIAFGQEKKTILNFKFFNFELFTVAKVNWSFSKKVI